MYIFILVLWAENSRYIIPCWSSRLVGCDDFFHALVRGDALCICLKSGPVLWSSPASCFTFTEFYVSISTRKAAQPCCPRPVLYRLIGLYETLFDKWKKNVLRLIIFLSLQHMWDELQCCLQLAATTVGRVTSEGWCGERLSSGSST